MWTTLNISRLMCKISGQNSLPNHDALFVLQRTNFSNTNMPLLIPPFWNKYNLVSANWVWFYEWAASLRKASQQHASSSGVVCKSLSAIGRHTQKKRYKKNWKLFQKNHARGVKSQVVKVLKTSSFRAKSCWEKYRWSLRRSVFDLSEKLEYSVGMLLTIDKNKRDKAEFSAESLSLHGLEPSKTHTTLKCLNPEPKTSRVSHIFRWLIMKWQKSQHDELIQRKSVSLINVLKRKKRTAKKRVQRKTVSAE